MTENTTWHTKSAENTDDSAATTPAPQMVDTPSFNPSQRHHHQHPAVEITFYQALIIEDAEAVSDHLYTCPRERLVGTIRQIFELYYEDEGLLEALLDVVMQEGEPAIKLYGPSTTVPQGMRHRALYEDRALEELLFRTIPLLAPHSSQNERDAIDQLMKQVIIETFDADTNIDIYTNEHTVHIRTEFNVYPS